MSRTDTPLPDLDALLRLMVEHKASDLFVTVALPPSMKIDGVIRMLSKEVMNPRQVRDLVLSALTPNQQEQFVATHECNIAISRTGLGRFRLSAFQQRGQLGMVLRRIESRIPSVKELYLPPVLEKLSMLKRGLILVVGGTGAGKSSTMAAMIDYRNRNDNGHILTIEDPIEYLHSHQKCIVTQREVGIDTESYEVALRNALRQAPNVITIGEIRCADTMDYAIAFAESGHLCLATLHANTANQALERIIHFFSEERSRQLLMDLSLNLKAVIAQQLIPTKDGNSRRVVTEVMVLTPMIADLILKGKIHELKELMAKPNQEGMRTFDQSLYELYEEGAISKDAALAHADSPSQLRLMMKLDKDYDIATGSGSLAEVTVEEVDR
ncbi:MAG TPA: PilT/PilU family type 4a pilus ATPase [Gammaproteobacteria bacterium]|nr:PilT/PilU family type 4a pilus ATPase [Gammaproteobacteria bacterium]